jgi:hypothetical protein
MSTPKHHHCNQPAVEAPLPSIYDGLKALCECIRWEWKTIRSKYPFGIGEAYLWTLYPILSTYPIVICWDIIVHLLFWPPFIVLLAVYGAQDRENRLHATLPGNKPQASQLLDQFPPEIMSSKLYYASLGLTLATQLTFIAVWYAKKWSMNHCQVYQSSENGDIEMVCKLSFSFSSERTFTGTDMRARLLDLKRHQEGAGRTLSIGRGSNIRSISPLGDDTSSLELVVIWSESSPALLFPSPSSGYHISSDTLRITFATQLARLLRLRLVWNAGFKIFCSIHG